MIPNTKGRNRRQTAMDYRDFRSLTVRNYRIVTQWKYIIYHKLTACLYSVSASNVKRETRRDPTLSKVLDLTLNGRTYKPQDERLKPFYMRRNELSVQNGCLMWGIRVIIPIKLRNKVLDELHVGHIGIVKM